MRKTFLLILLLTALPALGDITRGGWQTARPILLPALSGPGPIYLPLDEAALTARTLGEYRIVRAANLETPYRMVEERGQIVSYPLDTRVVSHSAPGSEQEEVILDLGVRPSSRLLLTLELLGNDFRSRVRVDGGQDGTRWRLISDQGYVFRQAGGIEQKTISLPSQADRFLRIRLLRQQGVLPRIRQVEASSEVSISRRLLPVAATMAQREEREPHRTIVELDPGRLTRDLAEARLDIAEPAFDRPVTVETLQEGATEWDVYTANGVLKRLAPDGEVILPLGIPQAYRLRFDISNGDDPPLTIRHITLWRTRRGLIFYAEPGQRYELWYGCPKAPSPAYDLDRLPLMTPPAALAEALLGAAQILPPPRLPWSERHPALFWSVLACTIVLLLLLIVRSMRGIKDSLLHPDGSATAIKRHKPTEAADGKPVAKRPHY